MKTPAEAKAIPVVHSPPLWSPKIGDVVWTCVDRTKPQPHHWADMVMPWAGIVTAVYPSAPPSVTINSGPESMSFKSDVPREAVLSAGHHGAILTNIEACHVFPSRTSALVAMLQTIDSKVGSVLGLRERIANAIEMGNGGAAERFLNASGENVWDL